MLNDFDNKLLFMNYNLGLCLPFSWLQEGQARKENIINLGISFKGFSFNTLKKYEPSNLLHLQRFLRIHLRTALFWVMRKPVFLFVCFWRDSPQWARASLFTRILDHTHQRTTVGRTSLDEWSVRRRHLYLTTHAIPTTDKGPYPRWDSKPRPQQASGRRPTPFRPRGHWDRSSD